MKHHQYFNQLLGQIMVPFTKPILNTKSLKYLQEILEEGDIVIKCCSSCDFVQSISGK